VIVIINSGPLMALAKLGLVDLPSRLYGQVSLPTAVFTEKKKGDRLLFWFLWFILSI